MQNVYPVANLHVDLYKSLSNFNHDKHDFQVFSEYVDAHTYTIHIRRLDQNHGWNIPLKVMACDFKNPSQIFHVSPPPPDQAEISIQVHTDQEIAPDQKCLLKLPRYQMIRPPNPQSISRKEFNTLFSTDIVTLPRFIYAVGIKDANVYMYNEAFHNYYESIHQIDHIVSVILTRKLSQDCYFLICTADGYIEDHYYHPRNVPRQIGEEEFKSFDHVILENPDEYAVLHKNHYVFTQSQTVDLAFARGIPDRHYIMCNLYNSFRSYHKGIPFREKTAKIVFGARNDRGSKYNFTERRDLGEMIPRQYFISDAVSKENIYCSATGWIDGTEMVQYKYILDIDGRASTWDGTAWKLNSGSVVFKQESCWRQWFYDDFLPWVHYVPVNNDFSNIQERFHWCEAHPEECETIVKNSLALFQKIYRYHNVVDYTEKLLRETTIAEN